MSTEQRLQMKQLAAQRRNIAIELCVRLGVKFVTQKQIDAELEEQQDMRLEHESEQRAENAWLVAAENTPKTAEDEYEEYLESMGAMYA